MRGMDEMQEPLFTTVKLEDFVPADHPLRPIRLLVNDALKRLNGLFSVIYAVLINPFPYAGAGCSASSTRTPAVPRLRPRS